MKKYVLKRLLSSLLLLLLASFLIYAILYTMPGSSTDILFGDSIALSPSGEKESLLSSYFTFILSALKGNFGTSLITSEKVSSLIASHFYPTFSLSLFSFFLLVIVFIPLSIICGKKGLKGCDIYISFSMALPSFLLSFILVVLFVLVFPLLPLAGYKPLENGVGVHIKYLILPSLTLALTYSGLLMSVVFQKVKELLTKPFFLYAKARGVKGFSLDIKYLLLPSLSIILSILSQAFISLLSGVAIVETIFNIPGLGSLLVTSVLRRDIPTATTLVLFITTICIVINFITDISIAVLRRKKGGGYET